MSDAQPSDSAFFATSALDLLDGIRIAGSDAGRQVDTTVAYVLNRSGLLKDGELTDAGRALFKLAWVMRREKDAAQALGQAVRQLVPIQVIEQELRGLGSVPEDGVLDLLRHHHAIDDELAVETIRPSLRWLNSVGVLVYSNKNKTIRSLAPAPDAALAGEVQAIASMVSPRTPYLNVVKLRRIIRPLKGTVWWVDAHFHARAMEELASELDPGAVRKIRILSGDADSVLTDRSLKDFRRFEAEMSNYGIKAEWRVDQRGIRDWHDRWVADAAVVWNVPPINTLLKNDYSEIYPASERPPFDDWWARSTNRI